MISIHKPSLFFLMKARMGDHKALTDTLSYNSHIQFPATGNSGEIVIIWDNFSLCIQDISIFSQGIYIVVKVMNPPFS